MIIDMLWQRTEQFPDARPPSRAYPRDSGFDVFAACDYIVSCDAVTMIQTGIRIALPEGSDDYTYGAFLADKSSRWLKGFKLGGGVIDNSYRGEIIVMAMSLTKPIHIAKHEKVANLIIHRVYLPNLIESTLGTTVRGINGFGSSGG